MVDNLTGSNKSIWKNFQITIPIAIIIIYCVEAIFYVYIYIPLEIPAAYLLQVNDMIFTRKLKCHSLI